MDLVRVRALALVLSTCLAGAALTACSEDTLVRVKPQLEVDPSSLDFGDGVIGADNVLPLALLNRGSGVLELDGIDVVAADAVTEGVFSVRAVPAVIGAISDKEIDVVFVPKRPHEVYAAKLVIRSNDPVKPALEVPLAGVGGVREIEVFPTEVDFGTVDEGTAPTRQIELRNLGGDPLVVDRLVWTSTSVDLELAAGTFLEGAVAAKTSTIIDVVYSPVDLGADTATLVIPSNDEDEPRVEVRIRGRANLAPRAIAWGCDKLGAQIGCDGADEKRELTAGFRKLVGLDGRDSYDPEGGAIASFRWVLVDKPDDSNATVFHSSDDLTIRRRTTGDIEIDRVGTYVLRLVARDDRGLESLDVPESRVTVTPRDLEVLLRWDVDTDVDLHVVRPGGVIGDYGTGDVGTSTGTDCSAFNRAPNWSDPATNDDDPSLDKDDVSGRGPEIVSLDLPEAGAYAAYVHYCDSRMRGVPVNVTVEVWARGTLVETIPAVGGYPLVAGELWHAADLTWVPSEPATVTVEAQTSSFPTSEPGLCFLR
ncbi:choice-of-anchor D domain-containing protein [Myxococcota bacterium]|nr:choice-of-anchor D domain-containing protein [Myxococcota bacterium]